MATFDETASGTEGVEPTTRARMWWQLRSAAAADERIVGLVDYGSSSAGREDRWSDVDAGVFIRDADFAGFMEDWKIWAARFGRLLLAYVGGVGHPWAVYAAEPEPLRLDFDMWRESDAPRLARWPNSPTSAASMVLYDGTGGVLTAAAEKLVGKSLRPMEPAATFDQVCGDFWYYQLRTLTRLRRGQHWAARHDFNFILMGNVFALLRFEAGALEGWPAQSAADRIEQVISAGRLAQLETCIPGPGAGEVRRALLAAAILARDVCRNVAAAQNYPWPAELAERVLALLTALQSAL